MHDGAEHWCPMARIVSLSTDDGLLDMAVGKKEVHRSSATKLAL